MLRRVRWLVLSTRYTLHVLPVQSPVGQTGRRLTQWSKKHRHAVELGDSANSALATWSAHHAVDWDNTNKLHRQCNYIKEKC